MEISTVNFVSGYLENAYGNIGYTHIPTQGNDRLWVHDLLHAILRFSPRTGAGEEATAIYQAVLLNDPTISERRREHKNHSQDVTLEDIRNVIIPGVRKFVTRVAKRYDLPNESKLSDDAITMHYQAALAIKEKFKKFFGCEFGDVPIDRLMEESPATYLKLIDEAKKSICQEADHDSNEKTIRF